MFSLIQLTCSQGSAEASGDLSHRSGCSVLGDGTRERGVVGAWSWNGSEFQLSTDTFGYLPYYYHHDPVTGDLAVSDSPQLIAAKLDDLRFDPLALGFFCRAGFMIGDRTLYEQVKRVPANSVLKWSETGFSLTSSSTIPSENTPRSVEEAVEGFIDRFRESMQLRSSIPGDLVIPLSSGRDSRMMLLGLIDLGVIPCELVTIGSSANADVRIAGSLSETLDIPFRQITGANLDWLEIEKQRHRMCGFEALEHSWLLPLWQDLSKGSAMWFDGLGCGSILRNAVNGQEALAHLKNRQYPEWCRSFFSQTAAPSADWIDQIQEQSPLEFAPEDQIIDLVGEELERHRDQPNPITSFTFHNWGRRSISLNPFGICRSTHSIGIPFMDRELVNWSLSIPAEWCFERDVQTEACHRLFPKFRTLPFTIEGSSNRNARSRLSRFRSRLQKRDFFKGEGVCFHDLYQEIFRGARKDPQYSRVVSLMTHLALADNAHTSPIPEM